VEIIMATIDYDNLFKKDAFKDIEPERIEIFKEFAKKAEGKNINQIMDLILEFGQKLPPGHKLTDYEKNAMMNAIFEALPENEKKQFKMIIKMAETFGTDF